VINRPPDFAGNRAASRKSKSYVGQALLEVVPVLEVFWADGTNGTYETNGTYVIYRSRFGNRKLTRLKSSICVHSRLIFPSSLFVSFATFSRKIFLRLLPTEIAHFSRQTFFALFAFFRGYFCQP
jgi:hypothetical protein